MKVEVINYSPGPMSANTELWDKIENKQAIGIEVIARLRYSASKNVCGFQFDITLIHNDNMIVKTGFLYGIILEELDKYIDDSLTREHIMRNIADLSAIIWPFVVGSFSARCADYSIPMILPKIDFYKFAEEVMLIKSE